MMSVRSLVAETIRPIRQALRAALRARRTARAFPAGDRLHVGSGSNLISGWINVDLDTPGAVDWDLGHPIPASDGSIRFIYSEHFIEHLSREQGLVHLRDCHRLLSSGGVLRMSTPNLRHLAEQYLAGNIVAWRDEGWSPEKPARFLNEALRLWGHQFVYDDEDLRGALAEAGFRSIRAAAWRQSEHPELRDLETRPYHHDLIVEAQR
jgi:predicted SAM-dependent methyltransferase